MDPNYPKKLVAGYLHLKSSLTQSTFFYSGGSTVSNDYDVFLVFPSLPSILGLLVARQANNHD